MNKKSTSLAYILHTTMLLVVASSTGSPSTTYNITDPINVTESTMNTGDISASVNVLSSNLTTTSGNNITHESTTDKTLVYTTSSTAAPQSVEDIPSLKTENVTVDFSIKYPNDSYTVELSNKLSPLYISRSDSYFVKIHDYYNGVTGFRNILSITFRNGSLIVDFRASFQYLRNMTDKNYLHVELVKKTLKKIQNSTEIDFGYTLPLFLRSIQDVEVCHLYQCKPGYNCYLDKTTARCKTELSCNKDCHDGECVFSRDYTQACICKETNYVVYTGSDCQETVEKFALKKDYIIAIAAGCGAGMVLIFSIIIIAMCFQSNNNAPVKEQFDEKDNRSEQSFQSMKDSEDGLRQPYAINSSVMADPTFRRTDRAVSDTSKPFTVQASSGLPAMKTSSAAAMPGNMTNDYQYSGIRSPVDSGEMRRQSRVRVMDDIEHSPDYDRRESRVRGSIDVTNTRKNSNFSLLPQRRRSSALADMRTNNVTKNPLYGMPQSRRKSSVYSEIEDNYSKSVMYQPGNNGEFPMRPTANPRLYDYYRRNESMSPGVARPTALSDIYDYDEDNSRMYGLRKSQQNPMARKY